MPHHNSVDPLIDYVKNASLIYTNLISSAMLPVNDVSFIMYGPQSWLSHPDVIYVWDTGLQHCHIKRGSAAERTTFYWKMSIKPDSFLLLRGVPSHYGRLNLAITQHRFMTQSPKAAAADLWFCPGPTVLPMDYQIPITRHGIHQIIAAISSIRGKSTTKIPIKDMPQCHDEVPAWIL